MVPPQTSFPYAYKPYHPQLHQPYSLSLAYRIVVKPLLTLISPLLVALRVVGCLLFLCLQDIIASIIDAGTDHTRPLSVLRRKLLVLDEHVFCGLCFLLQGHVVVTTKRPDPRQPRARLAVINHTSVFDILVLGHYGCDCIVAKRAVVQNPFSRRIIRAVRAIVVERGSNATAQMLERYREERGWPQLVLFPEGTVSPQSVVLRLRTGAFVVGVPVQPVVVKYHQAEADTEWLFESGARHVFQVSKNLLGYAEVRFMDVVAPEPGEEPRAFADRVGRAMAEELGAQYVPYTSADVAYFLGTGDASRCTPEYLRDYGWMGTYSHYRRLCAANGLDPRFEWPREHFRKTDCE